MHVAISCKALGSLGKPWMAQPLLGSDSPCLRSGGVPQMEGQAFAHIHGLKHLLGGGQFQNRIPATPVRKQESKLEPEIPTANFT